MNKKKIIGLFPFLAIGSCLVGCGNSKAPVFTKDQLEYLPGVYYGKSGAVSLDETGLTLTGKENLSLVPTNIGTISLTSDDSSLENNVKEALLIEFGKKFNKGVDYRLYADINGDGLLHLEKRVNKEFVTFDTFMPDVSSISGSYAGSGYADSGAYNNYFLIGSDFDFGRGVFYGASKYGTVWSYLNSVYWKSGLKSFTYENSEYVGLTISQYDDDDYCFGTYAVAVGNETYYDPEVQRIILVEGGYPSLSLDPGVLHTLSMFDGENNVAIDLDETNKTLTIGDWVGNYVFSFDKDGLFVTATKNEETKKIRVQPFYVTIEENNSVTTLVNNDLTSLLGSFSLNNETLSISQNTDETFKLTVNGVETNFSKTIVDNRLGISFTKGNDTYKVSPHREDSVIKVNKNGTTDYYINVSKYNDMYVDTFYVNDGESSFGLTIDNSLNGTMNNNEGQLTLAYENGNKFPLIKGVIGDNNVTLNLMQSDIGMYKLTISQKEYFAFSQTVLNNVFGEYSSDGRNNLFINKDEARLNGVYKKLYFEPIYQAGTGLYVFGLNIDGVTYQALLNGCLFTYGESDDDFNSFVKTDVFLSIQGTYSQIGKFGIESIQMTADGHLYLDQVNEEGTGLDYKVEFPYFIVIPVGSSAKAMVEFPYYYKDIDQTVWIYISFFEEYVTIADLNYYRNEMVKVWGTYADEEMSNVLFVQNDSIYFNGNKLSITEKEVKLDSLVVYTSAYKFTFYDNYVTYVDSNGTTITLLKKLAYSDFDKFVGEYTANNITIKFEKDTIGYHVLLGETKIELSNFIMVIYNGNFAIKIDNLFDKYYFVLDTSTNTVSVVYEGGSLPPLPPLPPLL